MASGTSLTCAAFAIRLSSRCSTGGKSLAGKRTDVRCRVPDSRLALVAVIGAKRLNLQPIAQFRWIWENSREWLGAKDSRSPGGGCHLDL